MQFPARFSTSVVAAISTLLLASCSSTSESVSAEKSPISQFLLVGDTGYHHHYPAARYSKNPPQTIQQVQKKYLQKWNKNSQYKFDGFVFPPVTYSGVIGGFVMESGLYPVAAAMTRHCLENRCDYGVMLGDNIYEDGATLGADGKDDTQRFEDMFVIPYKGLGKKDKRFKFYATLGNHDWNTSREGAQAQVDFMKQDEKFYMDGFFYQVKPPAAKGEVELFVVDTQMLLSSTDVYRARRGADGKELTPTKLRKVKPWTVPQSNQEKEMLKWLGEAMAKSDAKWKFVLGHHPLWASGGSKFEEGKALRKLMLPTLCEYADAYFAGHEHSLEIVEDDCSTVSNDKNMLPLLHVVSGAGGKQRPVNPTFMAAQAEQYPQLNQIWIKGMIWGFADMVLYDGKGQLNMFTVDGQGASKPAYQHTFNRRSNR